MHDRHSHARGWFLKAESDLTMARLGLTSGGPYDAVCFHAQQAAEKLLKGLMAFHGEPIPHTHHLDELKQRCLELQPPLRVDTMNLEDLLRCGVALRL